MAPAPGADAVPLEDSGAGGNARWRSEAERPGKTRVNGAWCTPGLASMLGAAARCMLGSAALCAWESRGSSPW